MTSTGGLQGVAQPFCLWGVSWLRRGGRAASVDAEPIQTREVGEVVARMVDSERRSTAEESGEYSKARFGQQDSGRFPIDHAESIAARIRWYCAASPASDRRRS